MRPTKYDEGWLDGFAQAQLNGKRLSGVFDKNGRMIHAGDTVEGLFYHGVPVTGTCAFRDGAYGIKWMRGEIEDFVAFCQCCNVEWEVQDER